MPTLTGWSLAGGAATNGSTVTINYTAADDSNPALTPLVFQYNDPQQRLHQIRRDGNVPLSGSIDYVIPSTWPSGSYQLASVSLFDQASNSTTYMRNGTVFKRLAELLDVRAMALRFSAGDFTVNVTAGGSPSASATPSPTSSPTPTSTMPSSSPTTSPTGSPTAVTGAVPVTGSRLGVRRP